MKDESDIEALRELGILVNEYSTEYEWVFKALKQMIKINFKLSNYDECLQRLRQLILITPHIKHSYVDESLTRMVNNYSVCRSNDFVHEVYNTLLQGFETSSNNSRLWLKIMISKLNLYVDNHQYDNVPALITSIKDKLTRVDAESKGLTLTYLPEVCAYEIEYLSHQNPININQLRQLHRESLRAITVLTHPRILGIIKECGGKLNFYRGNFEKARLEFYEAFKCYDEVGSQLKNQILKYVILCSIVTGHEVNPFESQETQAYAQLPDYENLVALYNAYESLNLKRTQQAIENFGRRSDPLADDDLFLKSTSIILDNLKSKILIRMFGSFKTIRFDTLKIALDFESKELDQRITRLVNDGVVSDIMVDYIHETISIGISSNQLIVADELSIQKNAKILDCLGLFENSDFHKTMKMSSSVANSTMARIIYSTSDGDACISPGEWLRIVSTGVPIKGRNGLSQKDQVLYELAVDSAANNGRVDFSNAESHNSSRAIKNTNAGILGSALTMNEDEEEDPDAEEDIARPVTAIREWSQVLEDKYISL